MLPEYEIASSSEDKYLLFLNGDLISEYIRKCGRYQYQCVQLCLKHCKEGKDVLDIGANIGTFAIPVAKKIAGIVHAFEVQRHVFLQLCASALLNRLDNIYPIHGCVTDNNSSQFSNVPIVNHALSRNTGAFSLNSEHIEFEKKRGYYLPPTVEGKIDLVRNVCIDEMMLDNVGFVKIDVEGAEFSVLCSMKKTLVNNGLPPICFECCNNGNKANFERISALLTELGYRIYKINELNENFIALKREN